jgi:hypothetical protein
MGIGACLKYGSFALLSSEVIIGGGACLMIDEITLEKEDEEN